MIFYFFYKAETLIFAFLTYTVIQTTLNYLLYKKEEKESRVLILDNENSYVGIIEDSLELRDNKYRYCGYLANDVVDGKHYLGRLDEIKEIVEKEKIEIIIFVKDKLLKEYSDLILEVKLRGVRVVDYLTFLENIEGKIDVEKIDSMWVLMSNGFDTLSNDFEKKLKRLFDVVLSFILFICFVPFMAVTYVMVKLDVGVKYLFINPRKIWENPAFFKQKRIGFRGKEFEIIKFRSMKLHDPNKYSKYASEHDDRITKVGHFIRKTRLDELPQVINVLRGDMSFVGPRPEWDVLGRDYEKKIKNYHLRYAVQPGITGWAQTMFTYGASVDDAKIKLEYDLYYVKNNSLVLDMIILFKTSKIVLFGKGM
jgi:exopolysaccharide biosynthesis polyprenyl glycosylphosphotransferase